MKIVARYNYKKLKYSDQEKLLRLFCKILCDLRTEQNLLDFLKDIFNRSERVMFVRRLLIGKLLDEGKTYEEIQEQLKVGKTTIARVERWLNFGRGGLKRAIQYFKKITR